MEDEERMQLAKEVCDFCKTEFMKFVENAKDRKMPGDATMAGMLGIFTAYYISVTEDLGRARGVLQKSIELGYCRGLELREVSEG